MIHHAYYIEDSASAFDAYRDLIRPFWSGKFERFGIDDARDLIALASLKNFNEAVFFVCTASITSDAQQSLLKLFEEPQAGTTFVLLAPHGSLLPTLKSRMLLYEKQLPARKKVLGSASPQPDYFSDPAAAFLRASGKERSEMIAKMLKDEEGLKERVRDFVNALETELSKDVQKNKQGLEDIAMVRDYLGDKAPSLKMLLEHLAVSLPSF